MSQNHDCSMLLRTAYTSFLPNCAAHPHCALDVNAAQAAKLCKLLEQRATRRLIHRTLARVGRNSPLLSLLQVLAKLTCCFCRRQKCHTIHSQSHTSSILVSIQKVYYVELGSYGRYSVRRFLEFKLGVMPVFQTPQKRSVASEFSAYRSSPPLKIRV